MPCRRPLMQRDHHQLQGPRPSQLVVTNHTAMKKRRRHPVIIYVESPKVIHAHPGEFRSVVQRLTGAAPPRTTIPTATTALPQFPFQLYGLASEALMGIDASSTLLPPVCSYLPGDGAISGTSLGRLLQYYQ